MDDDVTWKLRAGRHESGLRAFCNEAISDGRFDRLAEIANDLFGLRQQVLDVMHVHEKGEGATKPYSLLIREWKRTMHWLLFAELVDRERRMIAIRTRLMGPKRDPDSLGEPIQRRRTPGR